MTNIGPSFAMSRVLALATHVKFFGLLPKVFCTVGSFGSFPGPLGMKKKLAGITCQAAPTPAPENDPTLPVILRTAVGSIELAVKSMRHGTFDFLTYQAFSA
jgi:hypothetical protein